jgi:hypothetical protein
VRPQGIRLGGFAGIVLGVEQGYIHPVPVQKGWMSFPSWLSSITKYWIPMAGFLHLDRCYASSEMRDRRASAHSHSRFVSRRS